MRRANNPEKWVRIPSTTSNSDPCPFTLSGGRLARQLAVNQRPARVYAGAEPARTARCRKYDDGITGQPGPQKIGYRNSCGRQGKHPADLRHSSPETYFGPASCSPRPSWTDSGLLSCTSGVRFPLGALTALTGLPGKVKCNGHGSTNVLSDGSVPALRRRVRRFNSFRGH